MYDKMEKMREKRLISCIYSIVVDVELCSNTPFLQFFKSGLGNTDLALDNKIVKGTCTRVLRTTVIYVTFFLWLNYSADPSPN